jgi:hypothetical protein
MTATTENLIPLNRRTKDEQRAIQSAAGKASGAARRQKSALIKGLEALLNSEIRQKDGTRKKGADLVVEAWLVGIISGLKKGNTAPLREYLDRVDGRPAQALQLTGADGGAVKVEQSVDLSGVPLDDLIKAKALIYGGSNKGGDGSERG